MERTAISRRLRTSSAPRASLPGAPPAPLRAPRGSAHPAVAKAGADAQEALARRGPGGALPGARALRWTLAEGQGNDGATEAGSLRPKRASQLGQVKRSLARLEVGGALEAGEGARGLQLVATVSKRRDVAAPRRAAATWQVSARGLGPEPAPGVGHPGASSGVVLYIYIYIYI